MPVIGFKILQKYSGEDLEKAVNELINNPEDPQDDSWQPHGPMIVERVGSDTHAHSNTTLYHLHYIQAMIKIG